MVFHGQVRDGVVVFEGDSIPPDGSKVVIETVEASPDMTPKPQASLWDGLAALAGSAQGLPTDLARQHDHYIYGTPKR